MAIGGKHVALVALLLTFAAFEGKSSFAHAKSVSVVGGRKVLADPQESSTALLAEESTTTSEDTSEEQTSDEASEESSFRTSEETSEEFTDQTSEEQTSDEASEESSFQTSEETSEESTDLTSEEQTSEETSTEQAFNQEETEIFSEEVSDEPIESSPEESAVEETPSEETTAEEESWSQDVQAQENVEFFRDASEEVPYEETQMREMEEVTAPQAAPAADNSAAAPSTTIKNPDRDNYPKPQDDPDVFLQGIAADNALARQNERYIQACIAEDGCGTPE